MRHLTLLHIRVFLHVKHEDQRQAALERTKVVSENAQSTGPDN